MLLGIHSVNTSSRFDYVLEVFFKHFLQIDYILYPNLGAIGSISTTDAIVYSEKLVEGAFTLFDSGFLWQDDLKPFEPETGVCNGIPTLFPAPEGFSLPFDVFAATFYMLSRYEEYLPFEADAHGRFPAIQSLAYRHGFLEVPVVDFWVKWLRDELVKYGFPLPTLSKPPSPLISIDIDAVYDIRGKGVVRSLSSMVKPLLGGDWPKAANALQVFLGARRDPFDCYDYLFSRFAGKESWLQLFVLCAPVGRYDRAVTPRKKVFRTLVKRLASRFAVGLHPSYASFGKPAKVAKQKLILEKIIGKPINKVRQHYLLYRFPDTANSFIDEGLTQDFTLGFADSIGFRAGTCRPFPFFDLRTNTVRPLTLVPFAFMDRALKDRMGLKPAEAMEKIRELMVSCSSVGVLPVGLWHNDTLSDYGEWAGWKAVFEDFLNKLEDAYEQIG